MGFLGGVALRRLRTAAPLKYPGRRGPPAGGIWRSPPSSDGGSVEVGGTRTGTGLRRRSPPSSDGGSVEVARSSIARERPRDALRRLRTAAPLKSVIADSVGEGGAPL